MQPLLTRNALYIRMLLEQMEETIPEKIFAGTARHFMEQGLECIFKVYFRCEDLKVCPAETQGINQENWYQQEHGIRIVCGK